MRRHRLPLQLADHEIDLVPLIDCVFLLLLFFMLCGHLSVSERAEQITVPPARTATTITPPDRWRREVINLGGGRADLPVRIRVGQTFDSAGLTHTDGLTGLRGLLDRLHAFSETYDDPASGLRLPQVLVELRADADVPWGKVQEVEQVLADNIEPTTGLPKDGARRPFVHLLFSVRDPSER
ncbi:MAG: biopolymer transporter ExbD [Planctomycetes bacterium]|nr:biopolymer transporter ExbD [Planctomycetota bacterium]